jgi:hypothetical protein
VKRKGNREEHAQGEREKGTGVSPVTKAWRKGATRVDKVKSSSGQSALPRWSPVRLNPARRRLPAPFPSPLAAVDCPSVLWWARCGNSIIRLCTVYSAFVILNLALSCPRWSPVQVAVARLFIYLVWPIGPCGPVDGRVEVLPSPLF